MTRVEYDIGGTIVRGNIQRVIAGFRDAGFEVSQPSEAEYTLASDIVELHLTPASVGGDFASGQLMVNGEVECGPDALEGELRRLAKLLEGAGAHYLLEAEFPSAAESLILRHPEFRHPKPQRLERTYAFSIGNPLQPYGQDRITVSREGDFLYERIERDKVTNLASGTLAAAAVGGLAAELAASRFPAVPDHELPPGSGLTISSESLSALVNMRGARNFVGYGHIIALVRKWLEFLADPDPTAEAPQGMVVSSKKTESRFGLSFVRGA